MVRKIQLLKVLEIREMFDTYVYLQASGHLTPTLAAWPLRGRWALKSILWENLFLDHRYDFSLLSFNSFLHQFMKSKFMKKIPWHQNNFIFEAH